jgi:MinD-like ATPase involved in chromosome partitioning or flagellar assembly
MPTPSKKPQGGARTVDAFDLDAKTQSLALIYNPGGKAAFDARTTVAVEDVSDKEATRWIDAIAGDADDVLIDVPGGRMDDLANTFNAGPQAIVKLAQEYDREVVVVSVIGTKRDAIAPVFDAIDMFGKTVRHVVVKNGLFSPKNQFVIFEGLEIEDNGQKKKLFGKAAEAAHSVNAEIVFFPVLDSVADQLADANELPYAKAADDEDTMHLRHARNVRYWLDEVENAFRGTWLDPLGNVPGGKRKRRVIFFTSQKGGVGKTTVCRTLLDLIRRAVANGAPAAESAAVSA